MSRIVQEKFQVNEPNPADKDPGPWMDDQRARVKKGTPGREGRHGVPGTKGKTAGDWNSKLLDKAYLYNSLPPGMDITDAELSDIREQRLIVGGTDDVTDNPQGGDFKKGYVSMPLRPTDDMYTREHQDAFYEDVTVDGVTGFLERNNMLDRS